MSLHSIRKYDRFGRLSKKDRQDFEAMSGELTSCEARTDLISNGHDPQHIYLVIEGWLCRYKQLGEGRRQIIALLLPGDLCDTHTFNRMDHSIGTLTAAKVATISRVQLKTIAARNPRLNQALSCDMLLASAIQREWMVSLGQRTAFERIGHLFCELFMRLKVVGLVEGSSFPLPITQVDLADALGLSVVHTNRTLQDLRRAGLIVLKARVLTIPNVAALKDASAFSPTYLHLDHFRYDADEAGVKT